MPYILEAYVPTEVIVKRHDPDGRSWVAFPKTPDNEFWVGTAHLYDTEEACIRGNKDTLEAGIKQMKFEGERALKRVEAAKKLLHSISPEARIETLEQLLRCVYHNLRCIKKSGEIVKDTSTIVLAKETMEWIEGNDIPTLDNCRKAVGY